MLLIPVNQSTAIFCILAAKKRRQECPITQYLSVSQGTSIVFRPSGSIFFVQICQLLPEFNSPISSYLLHWKQIYASRLLYEYSNANHVYDVLYRLSLGITQRYYAILLIYLQLTLITLFVVFMGNFQSFRPAYGTTSSSYYGSPITHCYTTVLPPVTIWGN